jgi:LemA protein
VGHGHDTGRLRRRFNLTASLLFWAGLAVLIFWSVGAYNRLVRLRALANAAFAVLDGHWARQLALIDHSVPQGVVTAAERDAAAAMDELWAALLGGRNQLQSALTACRPHPLHAESLQTLAAAKDVLVMAWGRVQNEVHDLAGAAIPDTVADEWRRLLQATDDAQSQFNAAVTAYNQAIAQFPAQLLAWLFGFKAAETL